jgi:hypothetical protein
MGLTGKLQEGVDAVRKLSPTELKKLAKLRLSDLVLQELGRSRQRIYELEKSYPSAGPRELAQRLIDHKKNVAGMVGGVSGVFGLFSIPADLLVMAWLQLALLVDIATLYKANLKTERSRDDLLDLLGYANGVSPLQRASPKVLGSLAGALLARGGLKTFGRAVPLVAAPLTAYLNNQHIQSVGEQALRFYEGFERAHEKTRHKQPVA